jgi:hypothetical protein
MEREKVDNAHCLKRAGTSWGCISSSCGSVKCLFICKVNHKAILRLVMVARLAPVFSGAFSLS